MQEFLQSFVTNWYMECPVSSASAFIPELNMALRRPCGSPYHRQLTLLLVTAWAPSHVGQCILTNTPTHTSLHEVTAFACGLLCWKVSLLLFLWRHCFNRGLRRHVVNNSVISFNYMCMMIDSYMSHSKL